MTKRVQKKVSLISIMILILLSISCKKKINGIVEYQNFDFQKLEPILKTNPNANWYVKGVYSNDSLKNLIFLSKKGDSILKKDSVYYLKNNRYFVSYSKTNYINLDLIKITFTIGHKIQRHFLVKKMKKYYLLAIERQTKSFEFEIRRVNTNSYCLEFNDIDEYLKKIKISENRKFYFDDFLSFEILYKNKKALYRETFHFDWGNGTSPNFSVLSNTWGNLYLDLNNYKKPNYFIDSSVFRCLK